MNKRGQTFLIFALILIGVLVGLSTIYTKSTTTSEQSRVVDLSSEIYYEGAQVVDHGVFAKETTSTIENDVSALISKYSKLNPDSEITVIYGDGTGKVYSCQEKGKITVVSTASESVCQLSSSSIPSTDIKKTSSAIEVDLNNQIYTFSLEEGQNFFIVIKKETASGETIVAA